MPYPVSSAVSSQLIALLFYVPFNDWYMNAATGQLLQLTDPFMWDTNPYIDTETLAQLTLERWNNIQFMQTLTGQVIPYPLDNMQFINRDPTGEASGLLPCDGGLQSVVSYPALYALIGNTFGGDSTVFGTPDLRGRVAINADDMNTPQGHANIISDAWASDAGGTGGEAAHTLVTAEVPSHTHIDAGHTHIEGTATATIINGGLEAPAASAVPSVGTTGVGNASLDSSGGDGAHNNIQPSFTLFWYIVAY